MSLALSPAFPVVDALSIIVGTAYSNATSFIIQRPVFGALWSKSQTALHPREVLESKEAQAAAGSALTSFASAALQSYGVGALLRLTNVTNYKGAAILGTLLFAAQSAPQVVVNFFVAKQPVDVVLSTIAVRLLDTVGLALALQAYHASNGANAIADSIPKRL